MSFDVYFTSEAEEDLTYFRVFEQRIIHSAGGQGPSARGR